MTGVVPALNMTGAVASLNMTGAESNPNMTGAQPALNMTGSVSVSPQLNLTEASPALDLSGPPQDLAERTANLSLDDSVDPFQPATHARLWSSLSNPVSTMHGYRQCE